MGDKELRLAALGDIHPLLRGNTNIALREGDERSSVLYSTVENVTVPVTVIRCDYSKSHHMQYLFTIFHRLNSGGVRLNNQEIRNCIFNGIFNDTLKRFDSTNGDWQVIKTRIWGSVNRFRSVEILLRILAFSEFLEIYDGNIAAFLNDYMQKNVIMSQERADAVFSTLGNITDIARKVFSQSGSGKLSLATIEAVLVGISVNIKSIIPIDEVSLIQRYNNMLKLAPFAEGARYAVSSTENVRARLSAAISAFGGSVE